VAATRAIAAGGGYEDVLSGAHELTGKGSRGDGSENSSRRSVERGAHVDCSTTGGPYEKERPDDENPDIALVNWDCEALVN